MQVDIADKKGSGNICFQTDKFHLLFIIYSLPIMSLSGDIAHHHQIMHFLTALKDKQTLISVGVMKIRQRI